MITLHWWKKCVNINSLVWTPFWTNFDFYFWISIWLSHIPKSVFVPIPFEPKSIIFHNHTSLLDKGVEQHDTRNIFENWKFDENNFLDEDNFLNKTIHSIILLLGRIREVIGRFMQDPRYLDWAATLGPVRPPPEPPPWGNFPSFSICFSIYTFTMHWGQCMR